MRRTRDLKDFVFPSNTEFPPNKHPNHPFDLAIKKACVPIDTFRGAVDDLAVPVIVSALTSIYDNDGVGLPKERRGKDGHFPEGCKGWYAHQAVDLAGRGIRLPQIQHLHKFVLMEDPLDYSDTVLFGGEPPENGETEDELQDRIAASLPVGTPTALIEYSLNNQDVTFAMLRDPTILCDHLRSKFYGVTLALVTFLYLGSTHPKQDCYVDHETGAIVAFGDSDSESEDEIVEVDQNVEDEGVGDEENVAVVGNGEPGKATQVMNRYGDDRGNTGGNNLTFGERNELAERQHQRSRSMLHEALPVFQVFANQNQQILDQSEQILNQNEHVSMALVNILSPGTAIAPARRPTQNIAPTRLAFGHKLGSDDKGELGRLLSNGGNHASPLRGIPGSGSRRGSGTPTSVRSADSARSVQSSSRVGDPGSARSNGVSRPPRAPIPTINENESPKNESPKRKGPANKRPANKKAKTTPSSTSKKAAPSSSTKKAAPSSGSKKKTPKKVAAVAKVPARESKIFVTFLKFDCQYLLTPTIIYVIIINVTGNAEIRARVQREAAAQKAAMDSKKATKAARANPNGSTPSNATRRSARSKDN